MVLNALMILVVVILLIGIGALCAHLKVLGENAPQVLSRLVLRVGMPALIFKNLLTEYDRASLLKSAPTLIVPLATLLAAYLVSLPLAKLIRMPENRREIFRAQFTFSNSVFIGLPVCTAILGESSTSLCLLYYLVNTIFWWTVAAPRVAGMKKISVKKLASAPLVACITCIILLLVGFRPPQLLVKAAGYLSNVVTPLSMLFIGYTLYGMFRKGIRWEKGYLGALAGKLIFTPAICLGLCALTGISPEMTGAFFLQAGMPAQTQIALWAAEYQQDTEYATGGTVISTLSSFAAIPLYAWILTLI